MLIMSKNLNMQHRVHIIKVSDDEVFYLKLIRPWMINLRYNSLQNKYNRMKRINVYTFASHILHKNILLTVDPAGH